jgi:hypothetical protein
MSENQLHNNSPAANHAQNFGGSFNLEIYYIIDIGNFVENW